MKSIFFGSIGSLVECSEIQRKAFNLASKEYGLDWYWNTANYIKMLKEPGGLNRIVESLVPFLIPFPHVSFCFVLGNHSIF